LRTRLIRAVFVVVAVLIVALPVVGVYVFLKSRQAAAPASAGAPLVVGEKSGSVERSLLGAYLSLKDAEIHRPMGTNPTPVKFIVSAGDTADDIARNLQAYGLISDADLFKQLVKYEGVAQNLQAGEYELAQTMAMDEIMVALQRSRQNEVRVTVREGWRIEQIADVLSSNGVSTYDALLKAMRSSQFDASVLSGRPADVSLEGYLYPDTYQMDPRWSAEQVIDLLVRTMDSRFTPAMRQQAAARSLTIHQVLTLASLVEREAVLASERPMVASVYLNRMAKNMALEADATVQYALGYDKTQQRWWPQITLGQLRTTESPYNTYLRRDLPPGPICSPGLASIQGVLQPAKSDYLFYYAKGDGSHVFARTFEEHLENQKKYAQ
jgi:UPF0755 protein